MADTGSRPATRKVVVAMQVSLDGFVAAPDGDLSWMWTHFDATLKAAALESVRQTSTHVMGRNTYLAQAATWPNSDDEIAPLVNRAEKVVFSRTLDHVDWENSRLATSDLAAELADLRREEGGLIAITGGAQLAQEASRLGVVDEYQLVIHPITLGSGLPLFADLGEPLNLQLIDLERLDSGVLRTRFRPADEQPRAGAHDLVIPDNS